MRLQDIAQQNVRRTMVRVLVARDRDWQPPLEARRITVTIRASTPPPGLPEGMTLADRASAGPGWSSVTHVDAYTAGAFEVVEEARASEGRRLLGIGWTPEEVASAQAAGHHLKPPPVPAPPPAAVDPAHVPSCPACGHSPRVQHMPNGNVSFACLWCNHGVWGTSKAKAAECWAYFLGGQRHRAPVCLNCHNLTTNGTGSLCDPCIALG